MFRPPSIFHAGRTVSKLRRLFDVAGQPISEDKARKVVSKAWGWLSWSELVAVLDSPGGPSRFDEAPLGSHGTRGVMRIHYGRENALRLNTAAHAVRSELGLPSEMILSLCAVMRFTGRHEPDPEALARRMRVCRPRNRPVLADGVPIDDTWLTAEQFRESYRIGFTPPSPEWLGIARDLDAAIARRSPPRPELPGR